MNMLSNIGTGGFEQYFDFLVKYVLYLSIEKRPGDKTPPSYKNVIYYVPTI
jgi:hypothetical protein